MIGINRHKLREILRCFGEDIDATSTAILSRVNWIIFLDTPQLIAKDNEQNSIFEVSEIELDDWYFGARDVKGVQGQGEYSIF